MREDLYIERKISSGTYIPEVFADALTGFEETELTPVQLAYISEKITSYSSDIVFAFAAIAIVGALGTVFSSEPLTALWVMLFYGVVALLYKPVRNLMVSPVKNSFDAGNYKAYKYLVTDKFVNLTDVSDSPKIASEKHSSYYLSICGINAEVPFECYSRVQEGGFVTGVLIDVKDRKWFIVCSPAF